MPVCLSEQSPGGPLVAVPGNTNFATCAYVVDTGAEYSQGWNALGSLSIADAQSIGFSIGLVWAIAWTFKMLARFLISNWSSENE
jgi:hypothetical protein